jgi:hypothetical protein
MAAGEISQFLDEWKGLGARAAAQAGELLEHTQAYYLEYACQHERTTIERNRAPRRSGVGSVTIARRQPPRRKRELR